MAQTQGGVEEEEIEGMLLFVSFVDISYNEIVDLGCNIQTNGRFFSFFSVFLGGWRVAQKK